MDLMSRTALSVLKEILPSMAYTTFISLRWVEYTNRHRLCQPVYLGRLIKYFSLDENKIEHGIGLDQHILPAFKSRSSVRLLNACHHLPRHPKIPTRIKKMLSRTNPKIGAFA